MAGSKYHRLAVAQLSFNPAYIDTSGVSYLHEPIFSSEAEGLFKIGGLPEVRELRSRIVTTFIDHMSHKIKAVVDFAAGQKVEILVLPEYSVTHELLEECKSLSRQGGMVIVAGSHIVTKPAIAEYGRLRISYAAGESGLGRAACPVFLPNGECYFVEKLLRSKWESALVPGKAAPPSIDFQIGNEAIHLDILICIDAIGEATPQKQRRGRGPTGLVAVPSLTPSSKLFYSRAELLLASGKATLFANGADFGGSKLFARSEQARSWLVGSEGTEPLPQYSEALVVADVDLTSQFEVRKSTQEHFPVTNISITPLIYGQHSEACREFVDFLATSSSLPAPEAELIENVKKFVAMDYRLFPRLMQEKLNHFLTHVVGPGLCDKNAWQRWLTPIVIETTPSTDALRWDLCGKAIDTVNELTRADKYPEKTDLLISTYKHLVNERRRLKDRLEPSPSRTVTPLAASSEEPVSVPANLGSFEPPFFDRDPILSALQKFIGSSEKACFVLAGMRGMGKTSIARQAHKKVVPPTWKRIFISLTEGASYSRLLAELAHQSGLRLPSDSSLGTPARQIDLAQNLLLTFSHTPRLAIFLDDFQYLLEPNGEFVDEKTGKFVSQLIEGAGARRNKLIIVTNQVPKLESAVLGLVEPRHIKGLETKDSENLFAYWFRFEREDLQEQQLIHFPEKLLGVLNGHPLALKVAAKLVAESTTQQVESETAVFKRLRETIISFFLDRVALSDAEDELIRFASIFRLPVKRDAFVAWKADQAGFLLDSLLGRSLLETDGEEYSLHPIIRDHFYTTTPLSTLRPFHKVAGSYFLDLYKRMKTATAEPSPELLGEAIHHYLCAGERDRVSGFAFYKFELRPVALAHYRRREYELALKDYRVLVTLDSNDLDSHFHLALIYAKRRTWDRAEEHFGKAMRLKPGAYWVLQGYAHAKLSADHIEEAEQLLQKALEINPRHSPTLVDLGTVYARLRDEVAAESYFRQAIEADNNNAFAYASYARFLLRTERYEEGLEMAMAAVETSPRDDRNKQLVEELRARLQSAATSQA
jgi:Tfp pilus assembly protein PilF